LRPDLLGSSQRGRAWLPVTSVTSAPKSRLNIAAQNSGLQPQRLKRSSRTVVVGTLFDRKSQITEPCFDSDG
jgi:hypothetical protein